MSLSPNATKLLNFIKEGPKPYDEVKQAVYPQGFRSPGQRASYHRLLGRLLGKGLIRWTVDGRVALNTNKPKEAP